MEAQSGRGSCRASILAVQGVLNAPAGAEKHFERAFRHRSYSNVRAKRELLILPGNHLEKLLRSER